MDFNTTLEKMKNNPLSYRSILTIPRDVSFGLELELENVCYDEVCYLINKNFGGEWCVKTDRSLIKDCSAEINTPPLYNTRDTWVLLEKLGRLLEKLKPTFDNCSVQVNYDGKLLPKEQDRIKFLKLYAVYEDIVYRFSRGEDNRLRDTIEEYAYPIILNIKGFKNFDSFIEEYYTNQKRMGINFKNGITKLIEFRTPNATCNPILWQNYITFFYYLIKYSLSNKCNMKDLDEYIDRFNKTYTLEYYDKLHEEKALELSKKIFRNSSDQSYFLEQYVGRKK